VTLAVGRQPRKSPASNRCIVAFASSTIAAGAAERRDASDFRGIPGRPDHLSRSRFRFGRRPSRHGSRSQLLRVLADIDRPRLDHLVEAILIAGEQRPRGFLEAGQIASKGRHETIGRLLRSSHPVLALVGTSCLFNQSSERDRRTSRLAVQPIPVSREERDLTSDHAQSRATRPALCFLVLECQIGGLGLFAGVDEPTLDILRRSTKVHVNKLARLVVEEQDGRGSHSINSLLGFAGDFGKAACGYAPKSIERRASNRNLWTHLAFSLTEGTGISPG